jgi:hypothetical protein
MLELKNLRTNIKIMVLYFSNICTEVSLVVFFRLKCNNVNIDSDDTNLHLIL